MKPDEYVLEIEELRAPGELPGWLEIVLCGVLAIAIAPLCFLWCLIHRDAIEKETP